jgi:hypothetical protein
MRTRLVAATDVNRFVLKAMPASPGRIVIFLPFGGQETHVDDAVYSFVAPNAQAGVRRTGSASVR